MVVLLQVSLMFMSCKRWHLTHYQTSQEIGLLGISTERFTKWPNTFRQWTMVVTQSVSRWGLLCTLLIFDANDNFTLYLISIWRSSKQGQGICQRFQYSRLILYYQQTGGSWCSLLYSSTSTVNCEPSQNVQTSTLWGVDWNWRILKVPERPLLGTKGWIEG